MTFIIDQVDLECIGTNEKRLELVSMHMEKHLITDKVLLQVEKWVLLLQAVDNRRLVFKSICYADLKMSIN